MPLKRAVAEFGATYKDRFALRTYPGTSVLIFIFILGWSRTKPRVTLSAQTMGIHFKNACTNAKRCDSERAAFNLRADGNLPESHLSVN